MNAVAPHYPGARTHRQASLGIARLSERDGRTVDIPVASRTGRVSISYLSLLRGALVFGDEIHALIVMNFNVAQRIAATVYYRAGSFKVNAVETAVQHLNRVEDIATNATTYLFHVNGIKFSWRVEHDEGAVTHAVVLEVLLENQIGEQRKRMSPAVSYRKERIPIVFLLVVLKIESAFAH